MGIAEQDREHIFERFFQAESRRPGAGMGLGLHISQQIVELHFGSIAATFPEDGGTCFTVTLPLAAPQPELELVPS
jgi:signal transduction histidine kinase